MRSNKDGDSDRNNDYGNDFGLVTWPRSNGVRWLWRASSRENCPVRRRENMALERIGRNKRGRYNKRAMASCSVASLTSESGCTFRVHEYDNGLMAASRCLITGHQRLTPIEALIPIQSNSQERNQVPGRGRGRENNRR
ncbi:hypothetical protein KQX54_006400 [Cotesia glomerata]|uniref:Uncharacterized protein n=1 Tax=Cotesia glomerata TaxID=32391 RepID=A0AAV7I1F7_COTGL|nr:hypothetical protein KQX54_006400 [Cotesia glomerata]